MKISLTADIARVRTEEHPVRQLQESLQDCEGAINRAAENGQSEVQVNIRANHVENCTEILENSGYKVSYDGNGLTINWTKDDKTS